MVESGTYNLIYILTKVNNPEFTLKAMIAIKKATSSRVEVLLDAFVRNGIIEAIHQILLGFGDELLLKIEKKKPKDRSEIEKKIREI